jgi:transglutaminase-like putative cysteine protease
MPGMAVRCALALVSAVVMLSCALLKPVEEPEYPVEPWSIESYADFVRRNMVYLNEMYTTAYAPHEFVVDTDSGAVRVQELLDIGFAVRAFDDIDTPDPEPGRHIQRLLSHVLNSFDYRVDPHRWVPVREVIQSRRADCKGLSLLLLSLLTASGIEAYAAVSNGHMWVNAYDGSRWHVLETDTDPERGRIYTIPGFYENPLFKIYPNVSLKRKPRKDKNDVQ